MTEPAAHLYVTSVLMMIDPDSILRVWVGAWDQLSEGASTATRPWRGGFKHLLHCTTGPYAAMQWNQTWLGLLAIIIVCILLFCLPSACAPTS